MKWLNSVRTVPESRAEREPYTFYLCYVAVAYRHIQGVSKMRNIMREGNGRPMTIGGDLGAMSLGLNGTQFSQRYREISDNLVKCWVCPTINGKITGWILGHWHNSLVQNTLSGCSEPGSYVNAPKFNQLSFY